MKLPAKLTTESWLPFTRSWLARLAFAGALACGISSAWAQSFAISTYGGAAATPGSTNTGTGPATLARFNNPAGIAIDSTGANLYVADANNHVIRKVVLATGVTTTLAGTGAAGSADNATGTSATFNFPQGVAIDSTDANLYVADTFNHTIRKIVLSGANPVTTIAGAAGAFGTTDNATGTSARFNSPLGLAVDSTSANLYVADTGNSSIRQIALTGTFAVTTFAGSASGAAGTTDNATGTAARFDHPSALAADATNLYVADTNNHAIRKIVISSAAVSTLAGATNPASSGSTDATGAAARFKNPGGLVAKGANVYVADTLNNTIRQVVIASGVTTTLAGNAALAGASADGVGTAARFNGPTGIAADTSGNLYVADTNNQTIRFGGPAVAPSIGSSGTNPSTTVGGNATISLSGVTGNPTPTYQWQLSTNSGTSWTNLTNTAPYSGVTTATLTITSATLAMNGYQYQCIVSNGVGSAQTSTPRTLTVLQAPTITSANNTTFSVGNAGSFSVTATGSGTMNYTVVSGSYPPWASTLGLTSGVIAGTPPNTTGSPFTFTIQASNGVNPVATQSFTLTVVTTIAPSISGQPASTVTVTAGNTATFTVTASGAPTPTYQWQVSTDGGTTFNNLANGAITGGTVSGATTNSLSIASVTTALNAYKYRVVVTNSVSSVTSNVATLTVNSTPVITNSTTSFSLQAGQTFSGLTITTSGLPAPTTYAVSSGSLPAWASLNTSTGAITATRATTTGDLGNSIFSITATNTVGTSTAVQFTITVTAGPTITSGPANVSIFPGAQAQFTVTATASAGTLSYQWYRAPTGTGVFSQALPDGVVYFVSSSGGTSTLTVSASYTTTTMNGDQFRVVVTDSQGSTTSTTATLTILQAPAFTSQASATFSESASGSFVVQATGAPAPTIAITSGSLPGGLSANFTAGTNSSTLVISGTPAAGTSTSSPYTLQITASNAASSVVQNFTLTVYPTAAAPAFTTQPTSQSVAFGQTATFTVVATGSPPPTYQWQRQPAGTTGFANLSDGGAYSGATTASLVITGATTGMNGDQFQCVITNTGGSATSSVASLTVTVNTIVTTLAGQAGASGTTDATGAAARFNAPSAIAIDSAGNAYVADTVNSVIRKITAAGVVTTYAGVAGSAGSADGTTLTARFNGPYGVAVDATGNVYVADTFNQTIRMITPAGAVSTLAGLAGTFGSTDDTGTAARFAYPTGVTVGPGNVLYVADSFNHTIRAVTPAGVVTTFAGAAGVRGSADGTANVGLTVGTARFANPSAVAVDSGGNIYVADTSNHAIRKITQTGIVTTLAGLAGTSGSADGTGNAARFYQPNGIAVDAAGNTIYVADTFNHTIRRVTALGVVTTVAGLAGTSGSTDGTGSAARFYQPYGIAVDTAGNLFIADTRNHTIRRSGTVTAPTITTQPANKAVAPGQTATFTVAATGSPAPGYQWRRQAAGATGFVNLSNDATYSGVTTATLTVAGVTTAMNGDQFQCVVSNFVSPDAVTNAVTLSSALVAPVFTSAAAASFTAGSAGTFTVVASGTPAPTYSASGLPFWATLDSVTGVLSGTPPDASGSPFSVTLTANNGAATTQAFTLTVVVPVVAPAITAQPTSIALNRGATATFTVTASGTAPLTYQWSKNGEPITGATTATLTLGNIQAANFGSYTVRVANSVGSVTSGAAILVVNLPPAITTQPRSQTVLAGSSATLNVTASGDPAPTYQWRLNGVAVAGGNSATLTLPAVSAASAGNYDVIVTNSLGSVISSLAQLTVTTTSLAPVVMASPAPRTVVVGGSTSLAVGATGVPAPAYQWRKNGVPVAGATNAILSLTGAQASDAGNYDVVITNAAGGATSQSAALRVIARSYAGVYGGSIGGSGGGFGLLVRSDNSAVVLGFIPGATPVNASNTAVSVSDSGAFSYTAGGTTVSGNIAADGTVTGSISGAASASFTGSKQPDVGNTQALAGFYQAGVTNGSGTALAIVSAGAQIYVLTQNSASVFDGGAGTLDSTNRAVIATLAGSIIASVAADGSTITVSGFRNNQTTTFSGGSEAVIATQRLGNISTRARVDTGANIAIAGFVISGQESKPVLIRAIGPTLASFGVPTALGAPKLDLFRGSAVIASNTGWATAGNTAAIVAATQQAGAFALTASSADSVIFTTLAPGAYTAQVSAASGAAGVALIEVYDLSAAAAGQKLFNISTRATAGAGDATLIAGISVNGTAPKRVLVRAVGPGLAQFGLTGVLATPQLQIVKDGTVVASNSGLNTSPDAAAIAAVSAQVGAFALPANSADCALLVSLAPGNYSALVTGAGTSTGLAIVEVYEVP